MAWPNSCVNTPATLLPSVSAASTYQPLSSAVASVMRPFSSAHSGKAMPSTAHVGTPK